LNINIKGDETNKAIYACSFSIVHNSSYIQSWLYITKVYRIYYYSCKCRWPPAFYFYETYSNFKYSLYLYCKIYVLFKVNSGVVHLSFNTFLYGTSLLIVATLPVREVMGSSPVLQGLSELFAVRKLVPYLNTERAQVFSLMPRT